MTFNEHIITAFLKKGIKNKPLSKSLGLWYNRMCVEIIYKPLFIGIA